MKIVVGPAKRYGDRRLIYSGAIELSNIFLDEGSFIAVTAVADPIHQTKARYKTSAHYRYEIIFTADEVSTMYLRSLEGHPVSVNEMQGCPILPASPLLPGLSAPPWGNWQPPSR